MTLLQSLNNYNDDIEKVTPTYSGLLGLAIGGSRKVQVPNRAGFVYVRLRDNLSEVVQVYNDKVSPIYDLPVIIHRKHNRWFVLSKDDGRYENWGTNSPYLPRHGGQHSLNRDTNSGGDVVFVYPDQFMPLLVYPSGTAGAGMVWVAPYLLQRENDFVYVGNTGTVNLLQYRPTDDQAILGLVCLNRITGNPEVLIASGTPASASQTGTSYISGFLPYPESHQEPLYAVRLVSGTTAVKWENLYNARQLFGGGGGSIVTGSSGGNPAGSDGDIQFNDDGAFGGDAGFRYDATNKVVKIGENEFNTTDNGVLLQGGDTNSVGHFMETLGTGIASYITGIRGRGEVGTPAAVQADDVIFRMRGRAYDGSGLGQTSAEVRLVATETHSSTEHGADVEIHATPDGSTSLTLAARFTADGMGYQYLSGITLAEAFGGAVEWEGATLYNAGVVAYIQLGSYEVFMVSNVTHTSDADISNDFDKWNILAFAFNDADAINYGEAVSEDWDAAPGVVSDALDELAARTRRLEAGGWVELSESWSYASASTITVPSDATTRFRKGMRIRFKQGGGYKYYTLISCTSTVLTVDENTDYTVANSAITEIAVSFQDKPIGFPDYFNFSPSWTNLTVGNGSILARKVLGTDGMCNFNIRFEWGGTSSISGAVSITPSPAANGYSGSLDYVACGSVSLIDVGVALYMGAAVLRQTGVIEVRAINAAGTYAAWVAISSTVPFTWATTGTPDLMNIDGKYRY